MAKVWNGFFTFTFRALILNTGIIFSKGFTDVHIHSLGLCVL